MSYLWMIVPGYIFLNTNLRFFQFLLPFIICFKLNSMLHLKYYALTMEGKYIKVAMKQFISDHGMIHETSCPNTPKQNGVAECKNRTLLEITRALLIETYSPASFWPEALATATYFTNCLPSKPLNYKTPLATLGFFCFPSLLSFPSPLCFWMHSLCSYFKTVQDKTSTTGY